MYKNIEKRRKKEEKKERILKHWPEGTSHQRQRNKRWS
jgi:hypothetical protein